MKIDYISDLHLDFYQENIFDAMFSDGDMLLVAGDLANDDENAFLALKKFKEAYDNVCVVMGNHDLYGDTAIRCLHFQEYCKKLGIHLLNYSTEKVNGIVVGGGTCWCDFSYRGMENRLTAVYQYNKIMNDMRNIQKGFFRPSAMGYADKVNAQFLELESQCDVLLSHFGGKRKAISERYKRDFSSNYFYWNGERVEKPWVFGHQHSTYVGDNVYVNPLGYPLENNVTTVQSFEI